MASLNLKPPSPPGRPAAANGLNGGRPATSDGGPPRIRGRQPVRYPRWVHLVCAAVVAAHIAKFPALTAFAIDRSRDQPAVSDDISDELLASAVRTGVGVVVLFGAIIACVVLYAVARRFLRRAEAGSAPDASAPALPARDTALLAALSVSLVLPDAWSAIQVQALVSPWFWLVLTLSVATVTWRIGGRRAVVPGLALAMGGVLL